MVHTLAERRGLTVEHARQWLRHVGLHAPLEDVEGDADLVAAARAVLEEGVHQLADTVRNSLNFYRMQESAEQVEHGRAHRPRRRHPRLRRGALRAAPPAARAPPWSASQDDEADLGRLTVAAGLAVEDDRRGAGTYRCEPSACRPARCSAAGVIGAIFGSFLNVVAYRLPRGESLSQPRSRCPRCETPIKPYDNVPVLSWLALRGRCRACGAPISARYPLVEAGTALLCALVVLAKGADEDALLGPRRSCSCSCRSR